jgi:hypothetical protein
MKRSWLLALAFACSIPRIALAQEPAASGTATRAEAAERFDRGLRLFNSGDASGALAEFRRAYALIPNVLVLYNIGLVYAQLGRAVDAADALGSVLANPGTLAPDRLAIAQRTHDEQLARTAEIDVRTGADGAAVEVDGVEVAKLPLSKPLRVTSGTHVVGVIAAGFVPLRKEVTIAGSETQALQFDLVAMQGRLAHLDIKTHLPGADIFTDGQRTGTTPLEASLPLPPGPHAIELRRPSYVTAHADITLGDGALGELTLEPEEDHAAVASSGGNLALAVNESQVVVTIDGRLRGIYSAPLRLAAGPHHLLAERGNFEPVERDVTIDPGGTRTVAVAFDPTPEYRAQYVARAEKQRTWGIVSGVAGVVVAAAGAGLAVYDAKQRSDGQASLASLQSQSTLHTGEICDMGQEIDVYEQRCGAPSAAASSKVDDANLRDAFAWSAVGVGAAGFALGVILFATADDPHQYDREVASMPAPRLTPLVWSTRGGGVAGVTGSF